MLSRSAEPSSWRFIAFSRRFHCDCKALLVLVMLYISRRSHCADGVLAKQKRCTDHLHICSGTRLLLKTSVCLQPLTGPKHSTSFGTPSSVSLQNYAGNVTSILELLDQQRALYTNCNSTRWCSMNKVKFLRKKYVQLILQYFGCCRHISNLHIFVAYIWG